MAEQPLLGQLLVFGAGATVPSYLAHHIVDDVTHGEHNQTCRHVCWSKGRRGPWNLCALNL